MLTAIDFYKSGHGPQYPSKTEYVYSNLTPRSTNYAKTQKITVFGIQSFILKFLIKGFNEEFFSKDKKEIVRKYKRRMDTSLGPGIVGTKHIEDLHDLGYLPIRVKALPEGVEVSPKVPVMTIINTLPEFFWLVNYLETLLSAELWQPMTSASIAREYRNILAEAAERTGTPAEFVAVQGHDFSFRGMPGVAAASASGAGHLLSFIGTDTVPAIDYLEDYYYANADKEVIGVSVPATEHSVMCMGGKETELETFERIIKQYPQGIVSIVSDTWDFWKVLTEIAPALKNEIRARKPVLDFDLSFRVSWDLETTKQELFDLYKDLGFETSVEHIWYNGIMYCWTMVKSGEVECEPLDEQPALIVPGKTVFRPDSGNPVKILTGYKVYTLSSPVTRTGVQSILDQGYEVVQCLYDGGSYREIIQQLDGAYISDNTLTEAEVKGAVGVLWDEFGGFTNDKGFKQLNEVGLIYGDSITLERAKEITDRLEAKGFASGNVVLGIGSFTYQYNTRDTYGFAMKATWGQIDGEPVEIFKDPKTDSGVKKSAKGLLRVELENGEYIVYDQQSPEQESLGELQVVFENGKAYNQHSLSDMRKRIW